MNKRPIVIVASTRSGSTAFAWHLGKLHNVKIWTEPSYNPDWFDSFQRYITSGKNNYVLKVISYQIPSNEIYQTILASNCYKIKLTRSNKIEQIMSHYIGNCTAIWNSCDQYARGEQYTVPIDQVLINSVIQTVVANDNLFDSLNIKFDEELTYEELIDTVNLSNTGIAKIIPPTNYDLIKQAIEIEYVKQR
jgi:hypothetical protein